MMQRETVSSLGMSIRRRMGVILSTACVVAGTLLAAAPADAQYERLTKVDVSKKVANTIQRSRWAPKFVRVSGVTVTANPGHVILHDREAGIFHVVGSATSQPPKAWFESIIVHGVDMMTAYVCACGEENANPNDDDCGFRNDNDYNSTCEWEGDGESRCTCEPFVVAWGSEEHILTYQGDPAW